MRFDPGHPLIRRASTDALMVYVCLYWLQILMNVWRNHITVLMAPTASIPWGAITARKMSQEQKNFQIVAIIAITHLEWKN